MTSARPYLLLVLSAALLSACGDKAAPVFQGYVEGEFVHVASAQPGRLQQLRVRRGDRVAADAPLFELEAPAERAALQQAQNEMFAAQAALADLQRGQRPQELAVIRAQRDQAAAIAREATQTLQRDRQQFAEQLIARAQLEQREAAAASADARVRELQERLAVARLPGRDDQLAALQARVAAADALRAQAQWRLDETRRKAPRAALVADTLYREGEWIGAGMPVVRLLPDDARKIVFFVPQAQFATLKLGQPLQLACARCPSDLRVRLSYLSPQAEYTPPLIYSEQTRDKLVFRAEAAVAPQDAAILHPGLPVTVQP